MPEDSRDVLMKLVLNGTAIPAECSAAVSSDDALASGFVSASKANSWKGNYFAVKEFQFQIGVQGDGAAGAETLTPAQKKKAEADRKLSEATAKQIESTNRRIDALTKTSNATQGTNKPLVASSSSEKYQRFMTQGKSALRAKSYSATLEPIEITKNMDASSLTLFQAGINFTTFDSAVLIKRRGVGLDSLRAYLRIEITGLLITDFDWDEDDVVKEKIKFVCRKASVQYSVENDDGSFQKPGQPRMWSVLNETS